MVFGNFINKSLLLIIIKSTVQQRSVYYFICSGFCCCFNRIACAISSEFCFNSRHFQRSSVLCHWITSNCFLFSYWHLFATIISYFSIKSSRTNSLAARLLIERLCWSFFLESVFSWNCVFLSAYSVIFSLFFCSVGHQIGNSRMICLIVISQRSHELLFLFHPLGRLYAYQLIESKKSSHSQDKFNFAALLCAFTLKSNGTTTQHFRILLPWFPRSVNKNTEDVSAWKQTIESFVALWMW